jgi:23S rRNA pseudouridine955/2504/2580 synthase/23S rRNA pseudouridine1911/1915/1917 synthase
MATARGIDILWSSADFVAIAKPTGIAAIPGRGESTSVLEQLAAQLRVPSSGDQIRRLLVVHRLDKDTGGVMLFAQNRPAQQHVSHQFQNNKVTKEYLALVRGRPSETQGVIDAPLGPHPASPRRMAVLKHGGRPARTEWRLEETFRHFSLLRCFPRTGKTHQIRVHLLHAGMPLAIDPLYGSGEGIFLSQFKRGYRRPTRGQEERPLIDRLTLHAERLAFEDLDGRRVELVAPLPRDFAAVLNQLRRHGRA